VVWLVRFEAGEKGGGRSPARAPGASDSPRAPQAAPQAQAVCVVSQFFSTEFGKTAFLR
jgi:hypothetical protein